MGRYPLCAVRILHSLYLYRLCKPAWSIYVSIASGLAVPITIGRYSLFSQIFFFLIDSLKFLRNISWIIVDKYDLLYPFEVTHKLFGLKINKKYMMII
jgi:hypothetical protein